MRLLVGDLGEFRGVLEVGAVDAEKGGALLHDVALGDKEVVDRAGDSRGDRGRLLRAHGALGERGVLEDDALSHAADRDQRDFSRRGRHGGRPSRYGRHDGQKNETCFHVETLLGLNKRLEYHFDSGVSNEPRTADGDRPSWNWRSGCSRSRSSSRPSAASRSTSRSRCASRTNCASAARSPIPSRSRTSPPNSAHYWIWICVGLDSARFLMMTVSSPFSSLAVRVFGSAISGISALIA